MNRTRIAVAGAGYIGRAHMAVAQQSDTCTLSAVVDPSAAAAAVAAEAGVPLYRTLDELLDKDRPDGVILATPNQLHVEHARACLAAGVPTLLEKPIASTVDEAVALLAQVAPDDGRVLAGGQSLVPTMAFRLAKPSHLVDINGVAALNRLTVGGGKLVIGACVRHAAFHVPVCDGPLGKLLADVVRHIAHYPIRNRGTFCGSLAHADPASEWCCSACSRSRCGR